MKLGVAFRKTDNRDSVSIIVETVPLEWISGQAIAPFKVVVRFDEGER